MSKKKEDKILNKLRKTLIEAKHEQKSPKARVGKCVVCSGIVTETFCKKNPCPSSGPGYTNQCSWASSGLFCQNCGIKYENLPQHIKIKKKNAVPEKQKSVLAQIRKGVYGPDGYPLNNPILKKAVKKALNVKAQEKCDHGLRFDKAEIDYEETSLEDVRKKFPRLFGLCPKGCGYNGIAYASLEHKIYGDW